MKRPQERGSVRIEVGPTTSSRRRDRLSLLCSGEPARRRLGRVGGVGGVGRWRKPGRPERACPSKWLEWLRDVRVSPPILGRTRGSIVSGAGQAEPDRGRRRGQPRPAWSPLGTSRRVPAYAGGPHQAITTLPSMPQIGHVRNLCPIRSRLLGSRPSEGSMARWDSDGPRAPTVCVWR